MTAVDRIEHGEESDDPADENTQPSLVKRSSQLLTKSPPVVDAGTTGARTLSSWKDS